MAKKGKTAKKHKRRKAEPLVTVDSDCQVSLRLSGRLAEDPETVRRLAHKVVDVMAGNAIDTTSAAGRFMLVAPPGAAERERNLTRERNRAAPDDATAVGWSLH